MVKNLICISTIMLQLVSKEKMGPAMKVSCRSGVLSGQAGGVVEEAACLGEAAMEIGGRNGGQLPRRCPLWPTRLRRRGGGVLGRVGAGWQTPGGGRARRRPTSHFWGRLGGGDRGRAAWSKRGWRGWVATGPSTAGQ
jgi:hypothetical protein